MEFLNYFSNVFTFANILILILGTVGGLLMGAAPGLSPTMAVALLIPFTFHMTAEQGLIMLGAVYTSTVAGGAISAILLKIPGAPANIATVMDGYPMAKNGRSTEALHYCFISSFIGGVIGILVLIFFTPVLADVALKFGPSHMFWIAIFGVTVISSLDSKSIVKGLFSGAIGLWLATIGYDMVLGVERFVFNPIFSGGINIIAALVGLFAIPQVLSMLEDKQSQADQFQMEKKNLFESFKYNISRIKALIVGSMTGTIIGLIPGAGGQICVKGQNVMKEYYKNPEETKKSFIDDWFLTGDLGFMDEENYVFVQGRIKELIIKGGENISPREIDDVLYKHPSVIEAAAFAVPCSHYGEKIEAGVVLNNKKSFKEEDLIIHCKQFLGDFKSPSKIHFLKEMPKGSSGKIQRFKIKSLIYK